MACLSAGKINNFYLMSLGRGLGALITPTQGRIRKSFGATVAPEVDQAKIWQVPLSEIAPDPKQPRKNFKSEELQELSDSIQEHGILQPLLVSEKPDGGYLLVAGERRYRAAKLAGLSMVPVLVKIMADQTRLEVSLIENIQRADLNPMEEAFAYRRLIDEFHLTQEEVAKKVGRSRPSIANAVRLLDLPEEVRSALIGDKINTGQARALLTLANSEKQLAMLASMLGEKISVREVERAVTKQMPAKNFSKKDPNLIYWEDKLRAVFGTKVIISKKGDQGAVAINFYSKDELARLLKKLSG